MPVLNKSGQIVFGDEKNGSLFLSSLGDGAWLESFHPEKINEQMKIYGIDYVYIGDGLNLLAEHCDPKMLAVMIKKGSHMVIETMRKGSEPKPQIVLDEKTSSYKVLFPFDQQNLDKRKQEILDNQPETYIGSLKAYTTTQFLESATKNKKNDIYKYRTIEMVHDKHFYHSHEQNGLPDLFSLQLSFFNLLELGNMSIAFSSSEDSTTNDGNKLMNGIKKNIKICLYPAEEWGGRVLNIPYQKLPLNYNSNIAKEKIENSKEDLENWKNEIIELCKNWEPNNLGNNFRKFFF